MNEEMALVNSVDALETVTLRLASLHSMILSLSLGMRQENMEQQAVDCMEGVGYCVNDIRAIAAGRLQQIKAMQGDMDKAMGHE